MYKFENELISVKENFDYNNLVQIENITRTWFQLMINLNESPKIRSFFANEDFKGEVIGETLEVRLTDNENDIYNDWEVTATEYTRHFLTSGLSIYEITKLTDDQTEHDPSISELGLSPTEKLQTLVITADSSEDATELLRKLSSSKHFEVVNLHRWVGCGMQIPSTAKLHLDPNIVWPILEFVSKVGDNEYKYRIENSSNVIRWSINGDESNALPNSSGNNGAVVVQDKIVQGQAKGEFSIKGNVVTDSVQLTLPYTCASFDILTKINLGEGNDEQLVIFTS